MKRVSCVIIVFFLLSPLNVLADIHAESHINAHTISPQPFALELHLRQIKPATLTLKDSFQEFFLDNFDLVNDTSFGDMTEEWPNTGTELPPLKGLQISDEFFAGILGGILGIFPGIFGGFLLSPIFCKHEDAYEDNEISSCLRSSLAFGIALGFNTGVATGVYVMGSRNNETGSFWAAFIGGLLPMMIIHAGVITQHDANKGYLFTATLYSSLVFIPTGAVIGFNLTRKPKSPPETKSALLNRNVHTMQMEKPFFVVTPLETGSKSFYPQINLLHVRF